MCAEVVKSIRLKERFRLLVTVSLIFTRTFNMMHFFSSSSSPIPFSKFIINDRVRAPSDPRRRKKNFVLGSDGEKFR